MTICTAACRWGLHKRPVTRSEHTSHLPCSAHSVWAQRCLLLQKIKQTFSDVALGELRSSGTNTKYIFLHGATAPSGPGPPYCRGFTIILRHTTVGGTPLDEWSARRRDLCLTTQTLYKRQTSMPPTGLEPTIPASARPQIHALDRATTGVGNSKHQALTTALKQVQVKCCTLWRCGVGRVVPDVSEIMVTSSSSFIAFFDYCLKISHATFTFYLRIHRD
jgi:hypothetical protein